MSSLRVLEIVKIGLSENLTHLPSTIFAKISPTQKIPELLTKASNMMTMERKATPSKMKIISQSGVCRMSDATYQSQ